MHTSSIWTLFLWTVFLPMICTVPLVWECFKLSWIFMLDNVALFMWDWLHKRWKCPNHCHCSCSQAYTWEWHKRINTCSYIQRCTFAIQRCSVIIFCTGRNNYLQCQSHVWQPSHWLWLQKPRHDSPSHNGWVSGWVHATLYLALIKICMNI